MAEKMTKQELMTWAEQRLNLALTKNMTKIEMESQIMSGARKQGVKINDIKIEFNDIYHDRTGKYLLCVFNK